MEYTVEVYKRYRRCKDGEKLIDKVDFKDAKPESLRRSYEALMATGKYRVEIRETYVVKRNILSGEEFKERYDTPYYCSPSSETYWSS